MKNKILVVLLIASLGVNIGLLVVLLHPRGQTASVPSSRADCSWQQTPMRRDLGLKPEQVTTLENWRRDLEKQLAPLQDGLTRKRAELCQILKTPNASQTGLDELIDGIAALQAQIERKVVDHALQIKTILDPAQQAKFDSFMELGLCGRMGAAASCQKRATAGCSTVADQDPK